MVQQPAHSIIAELEEAVRGGSSARRVETLRQVTDLFLNDGERLSEDQVRVFDDVLCLLIARVETRARAELSKRLAPLDYAPFEVIQYLAWDDDISVAGEVLTHSNRISTDALVEIASSKGQEHLLALSARDNLPEAVTDVIVDRGQTKVIRRLAKNATARFSETGYSGMVAHSEGDDELVEILGLRLDLPIKFLRDLLRRAKDAVRARLLALAPPALQDEIRRVIEDIVREGPPSGRDFRVAEELVRLMLELKELDDAAVYDFAEAGKFDEVMVSLAVLNDVPAEMMARLIEGPRADLILIPCRSARLNWPTVESILRNRPVRLKIDDQTLTVAERDYRKLSLETAQRTVRFWQLHNRIEKQPHDAQAAAAAVRA
ncbi:MAG: DUF2336 domain-containing protein [Rhizobiales bacterium]|nr:DUF2336 domain-containing protein [Hyphomicrobiales bacterium]